MNRLGHRWLCVPAVPAFSQKGKNIVPFNLFIKLLEQLEQLEHWNNHHKTRRHRLLYVQPAAISYAPQLTSENQKDKEYEYT